MPAAEQAMAICMHRAYEPQITMDPVICIFTRFFFSVTGTQVAAVNCRRNLTSFSLKSRMSVMPYFNMAGRSIPMPKA